ncbi:MAG TPA: LegC family aminotransferase [Deltaproteobacteria bacterium]|nr:LegC family aminotransferase [Deltaproteobacteria bacterium]
MSEFIPLSVPRINGNEWTYIKECLDSEWVSSVGSYVERFEADIRRFTGASYAVACVNGTAALHVALRLAGVSAGDEVLVPTLTFIAPVNTIAYLGAHPVFMDADAYYNIDPEKTLQFLRDETVQRGHAAYNKATGRRVAALLPVHVFGNACRLEELAEVCRERGIAIVEDATEGLGTFYRAGTSANKHVGTIGMLGCLSFNGNKIITTGGGGMILTEDPGLAARAKYLSTQAKDDAVQFIHGDIGYNYRLTNIQAALGVAQLEQLPGFLEVKKENFELYNRAIEDITGLCLASPPSYADNNHWMYTLQVEASRYGRDRFQLLADLEAAQVQTRPVWMPNHLQKPYRDCQSYKVKNAVKLWDVTLNLPCSTGLTPDQVEAVVGLLRQ